MGKPPAAPLRSSWGPFGGGPGQGEVLEDQSWCFPAVPANRALGNAAHADRQAGEILPGSAPEAASSTRGVKCHPHHCRAGSHCSRPCVPVPAQPLQLSHLGTQQCQGTSCSSVSLPSSPPCPFPCCPGQPCPPGQLLPAHTPAAGTLQGNLQGTNLLQNLEGTNTAAEFQQDSSRVEQIAE